MTLRASPFGNTSNAATVAVMKRDISLLIEILRIFFQISSETPRVDTATLAVSDFRAIWVVAQRQVLELIQCRSVLLYYTPHTTTNKSRATSQKATEFLAVHIT